MRSIVYHPRVMHSPRSPAILLAAPLVSAFLAAGCTRPAEQAFDPASVLPAHATVAYVEYVNGSDRDLLAPWLPAGLTFPVTANAASPMAAIRIPDGTYTWVVIPAGRPWSPPEHLAYSGALRLAASPSFHRVRSARISPPWLYVAAAPPSAPVGAGRALGIDWTQESVRVTVDAAAPPLHAASATSPVPGEIAFAVISREAIAPLAALLRPDIAAVLEALARTAATRLLGSDAIVMDIAGDIGLQVVDQPAGRRLLITARPPDARGSAERLHALFRSRLLPATHTTREFDDGKILSSIALDPESIVTTQHSASGWTIATTQQDDRLLTSAARDGLLFASDDAELLNAARALHAYPVTSFASGRFLRSALPLSIAALLSPLLPPSGDVAWSVQGRNGVLTLEMHTVGPLW